jgi:glyoxylase I family protein
MEKVLGFGGFFFRAQRPKELAEWYRATLGIDRVPQSAEEHPWRPEGGPTAFTPFPESSDYFGDDKKVWMINFRVKNLDAFVAQLQAAGVAVKMDPEKYPYGRFARLHDPEGNPIELWEDV